MKSIPFLRVAGEQIGAYCRDVLQGWISRSRVQTPSGYTWENMCREVLPYRDHVWAALPWVAEELEACARGAGVDPGELWVLAVEKLWHSAPDPAAVRGESVERCSDFAAGPPATFDGGIWLAHNNDLPPEVEDELVAIHWEVTGQPAMFTLGIGPFISVGFNAAGLSLTGNEVSPNDDRDKVGVPRLLIVREILAQSTSAGAIAAAIRPDRSSSYNNLIAHLDGTIVNVEGSAGDHALLPAEDGWTVHTNHYVAEKMLRYETGGDYVWRSGLRYDRAGHLMRTRPGPVTPGMLKAFLRDHENAPYCLCRHGENAHTVTVFWCVIDLNHGAIEYGRGVPCECDGGTRFAF